MSNWLMSGNWWGLGRDSAGASGIPSRSIGAACR